VVQFRGISRLHNNAWMKLSYEELSKTVNDSYKKTEDVRETVKETGVPFNEVWDMTGLKDWFDFYETDED
jgi:hypothetical protein